MLAAMLACVPDVRVPAVGRQERVFAEECPQVLEELVHYLLVVRLADAGRQHAPAPFQPVSVYPVADELEQAVVHADPQFLDLVQFAGDHAEEEPAVVVRQQRARYGCRSDAGCWRMLIPYRRAIFGGRFNPGRYGNLTPGGGGTLGAVPTLAAGEVVSRSATAMGVDASLATAGLDPRRREQIGRRLGFGLRGILALSGDVARGAVGTLAAEGV